jgi:hypothetical protein
MRSPGSLEQAQTRPGTLTADPGLTPLESAILRTVAYADVFDFPVTASEIHRYLIGIPATQTEIDAALREDQFVSQHVERHGNYYTLPGRGALIEIRGLRQQTADSLWPAARRYAGIIARLPFVRMVAITGALAVDNPTDGDDIDYLIITEPGRLWLCRAMVIGVVRLAQLRGDVLCPNFFLSEHSMLITEQTLFSAHELAQMVPIAGSDLYLRMMRTNQWMLDYLPNTGEQVRRFDLHCERHSLKSAVESLLLTRLGAALERWEMRRKIAKLTRRLGDMQTHEVAFSADRCQAHFDQHEKYTMSAYALRLHRLEADPGDAR